MAESITFHGARMHAIALPSARADSLQIGMQIAPV